MNVLLHRFARKIFFFSLELSLIIIDHLFGSDCHENQRKESQKERTETAVKYKLQTHLPCGFFFGPNGAHSLIIRLMKTCHGINGTPHANEPRRSTSTLEIFPISDDRLTISH